MTKFLYGIAICFSLISLGISINTVLFLREELKDLKEEVDGLSRKIEYGQ